MEQPAPELGQNTYADVPCHTPPQIKDLADTLLQGLANIRKHVEWSNFMALCQGQWCQPQHASAQAQLSSTIQYLHTHKQLDATEIADINYFYTSLLGMPAATSSSVAPAEARGTPAAPSANMQTHATSLQIQQAHLPSVEAWKTNGDQLIADEQQEQARAAAKKSRKQKQKARKKSLSASAEPSQGQSAESSNLSDSTTPLAHTSTPDTASSGIAADYQDDTSGVASNNVTPTKTNDLAATPSTPFPSNRRSSHMSPLVSPPVGVSVSPDSLPSAPCQTLQPALLPLLPPVASARQQTTEAQASSIPDTVMHQLGASAAAGRVLQAVHTDAVAPQAAADVSDCTHPATARTLSMSHSGAEARAAECIKPQDRCFFGTATVPAHHARLVNRSVLYQMCCPITQVNLWQIFLASWHSYFDVLGALILTGMCSHVHCFAVVAYSQKQLTAISTCAMQLLYATPVKLMLSRYVLQDIFADPVIAADGYTYERMAIEHWLQQYNESPVTRELLPHKHVIANFNIRSLVAVMQS